MKNYKIATNEEEIVKVYNVEDDIKSREDKITANIQECHIDTKQMQCFNN